MKGLEDRGFKWSNLLISYHLLVHFVSYHGDCDRIAIRYLNSISIIRFIKFLSFHFKLSEMKERESFHSLCAVFVCLFLNLPLLDILFLVFLWEDLAVGGLHNESLCLDLRLQILIADVSEAVVAEALNHEGVLCREAVDSGGGTVWEGSVALISGKHSINYQ